MPIRKARRVCHRPTPLEISSALEPAEQEAVFASQRGGRSNICGRANMAGVHARMFQRPIPWMMLV